MGKVLKAGCVLLDIKNKKVALVYREKFNDFSFNLDYLKNIKMR